MQGGPRDTGSRRPFEGRRPVELTFAVDDEESPAKVTVSPRHAVHNTTVWLTVDVDHVVDLAEHA